jgi:anion-transporting  ArsA/GET3 family ATPase
MNAQSNELLNNMSNFQQLYAVNVGQHTEKKGKFTYLSWTFAVAELMKKDPLATWSFREHIIFPDGTMMVHCDVTAFNKSMYMFLPVMNNMNKAIKNPDAMAVNTAMMRCLVKGIAVHGLGLYIYAGEDLPEDEKEQIQQQQTQAQQQAQQEYEQDLRSIESAENLDYLTFISNKYKGSQVHMTIRQACKAKSDKEGWLA